MRYCDQVDFRIFTCLHFVQSWQNQSMQFKINHDHMMHDFVSSQAVCKFEPTHRCNFFTFLSSSSQCYLLSRLVMLPLQLPLPLPLLQKKVQEKHDNNLLPSLKYLLSYLVITPTISQLPLVSAVRVLKHVLTVYLGQPSPPSKVHFALCMHKTNGTHL